MSCNGYGHSLDCNCGWGGVFYNHSNIKYSADYWKNESSYSNPNALCPECKAPVFFYRSPEGGAVFFDHPGPPWPKHPCTDNENKLKSRTLIGKQKGWWPFLCGDLYSLINNEGTALHTTDGRRIFAKGKIKLGAPFWIRKINGNIEGEYEISTLKTKALKTYGVTYEAFSDNALGNTKAAQYFQNTILLLNGEFK